MVNNSPANAGDIRATGSTPGLGRSPMEGHNNPLHYSCLQNPKDRGAWRATVHRVAKSQTRLSDFTGMHAPCYVPRTGQAICNFMYYLKLCEEHINNTTL